MNVVITTLFTRTDDPQRPGFRFPADTAQLDTLLASLHDCDPIVLHDEPLDSRDGVTFEKVETGGNPYFQRWLSIREWLQAHPEVRRIWCVDGTDVEMLHYPFHHQRDGILYVGSEPATVGLEWLARTSPSVATFCKHHRDHRLLNAGLCGGDRDTILAFLSDLIATFHLAAMAEDMTDMGVFNLTAWTRYSARLVTGEQVHTVFRAEDRTNPFAWWRHK